MVSVHIPALLRGLCGGAEQVALTLPPGERPTVGQVLELLEPRCPGLWAGLTAGEELLPGLAVFIDNEQARLGLRARVGPDSVILFIPPVAGGR